MSWCGDVLSKASSLDLPDLGDPIKDAAIACGLDEKSANLVAFGACLSVGDTYGAFQHGLDVAEDQGLTVDMVQARPMGAGHYPAPDDVEGWKAFIEEQGYEAFVQAYKDGRVDDAVVKDPGFMMVFQDEQATYQAGLQFRSNLMASENKIRELIARNLGS